jgi:transposase
VIITSIIGIGDLLGAEFLAATCGTVDAFASADHVAGYAGLAPTARGSGSRTGNLHHPRRYDCQVKRVFYTSALISIQPARLAGSLRPQTGRRHASDYSGTAPILSFRSSGAVPPGCGR